MFEVFIGVLALFLFATSSAVSASSSNVPVKEHSAEIQKLTPLAEAGDPQAQAALAEIYSGSHGGPVDYAKALKWTQAAADHGVVQAQYNLGVFYYFGLGVNVDYVKAEKWYRIAAEKGMPEGQFNLGVLYDKGRGVPQDFHLAKEWYEKSAAQDYPQAMYNLGVFYEYGKGIYPNFKVAKKWYEKAAEKGLPAAVKIIKEIEANGGKSINLPFTEEENFDGSRWVWWVMCNSGFPYDYCTAANFPESRYFVEVKSLPQKGDVVYWKNYVAFYSPEERSESFQSDFLLITAEGPRDSHAMILEFGQPRFFRFQVK